MTFLANILWFVFGGAVIGLFYTVTAVILFPLFPFIWPFAKLAFWPYGRRPVSLHAFREYKKRHNVEVKEPTVSELAGGLVKILATILWFVTFGWIAALLHIISGIWNALFFWLIIPIPFISAHFRLAKIILSPFNHIIVPGWLADKIDRHMEMKKFGLQHDPINQLSLTINNNITQELSNQNDPLKKPHSS